MMVTIIRLGCAQQNNNDINDNNNNHNNKNDNNNENCQAWVCAAKECFLTWSFFGGSLLQLASHNK